MTEIQSVQNLNLVHDLDEPWVSFHYRAALLTRKVFFLTIEVAETRNEIFFDVIQMEFVFVQFVVAVFAKPHEAIIFAFSTLALNH